MRKKIKRKLFIDLIIIFVSVLVAVFIVITDALSAFLTATSDSGIIGSFVSGIFFTSVFTIAPATAAIIELADSFSATTLALYGAAGAMIGDYFIFLFIRDQFADNVLSAMKGEYGTKMRKIFHKKIFRWTVPLLGALVIASPLPDEIGLAMMGFSKLRTVILLPISFSMNFVGIYIISLLAN